MKPNDCITGYVYDGPGLSHAHGYLLPGLLKILSSRGIEKLSKKAFELGCGNGSIANCLSQRGWEIAGVDPSEQGISFANAHYPHLPLKLGSAYEDLSSKYGTFPVVISLEVVEHVYAPRKYARTLFSLVDEGGVAIVSTPYHGYFKNLVLAITGQMDAHFTALWDHGHIKFWSERTLQILLEEAGFKEVRFIRMGRIHPLAKSMIAVAKRLT